MGSLSYTANPYWLSHIWYYKFPCYHFHTSHPLHPPLLLCPEVCFLCLFLHCCADNKFISTIFLDSRYVHQYMILIFLFLTYLTLHNRLYVWLRGLKQGLCDNPEGWGEEGDGREVQEGGEMGVPMTDFCWCMTENHKILWSKYHSVKKTKWPKKKKVLWDPEDRSILGRSDIWLRAWWMNRITGYANNRKALLWRKYKESILENREDHPVTENRVWWTTTVGKPGEGSGQHWVEKDHELLAKDFILGHGAWKWFPLYNPLEVEIKIRCVGHHKNRAKHPMAQRWDRSTLNGES